MFNISELLKSVMANSFEESPPKEYSPELPDSLLLDYPYNSQRDNKLKPYAACNITCVHILFGKRLNKLQISDDSLMSFINSTPVEFHLLQRGWSVSYREYFKNHKAEKIWKVLEWLCNLVDLSNDEDLVLLFKKNRENAVVLQHLQQIFKHYYHEEAFQFEFKHLNFDEIIAKLNKHKIPVITGGKFTNSGHYITLVGYNINPDESITWVSHDPWGDATTGYKIQNGKFVSYTDNYLYNILHSDGIVSDGKRAFRTITYGNSK